MEAILSSAAVAAIVGAVVSWLVARVNKDATIAAAERQATAAVEVAEINAAVARERLAHDRQQLAQQGDGTGLSDADQKASREAFLKAVKAWRLAAVTDAEWGVRDHRAGEARSYLIEARMIIGSPVSTPELEELLRALDARTEDGLARAAQLWPLVEETFMATQPRRY
jgi:hypothetical protein